MHRFEFEDHRRVVVLVSIAVYLPQDRPEFHALLVQKSHRGRGPARQFRKVQNFIFF